MDGLTPKGFMNELEKPTERFAFDFTFIESKENLQQLQNVHYLNDQQEENKIWERSKVCPTYLAQFFLEVDY